MFPGFAVLPFCFECTSNPKGSGAHDHRASPDLPCTCGVRPSSKALLPGLRVNTGMHLADSARCENVQMLVLLSEQKTSWSLMLNSKS